METTAKSSNRETADYDASIIEPKWRERWESDDLYRVSDETDRENWYSLTMYPYPSGTLHVGHWYAFAIPDTFARFQQMRGYNVLFPMGFDAFGLPAENAAIHHGVNPAKWTFANIEHMETQYRQMGAMIDWSREIITCTPEYYRWNQWIFLRMLERGLIYRKDGPVWWCPNDQTVLANEQVIDGNICERCGAEVSKRDLEQWYCKITDYADELLEDLDELDWPESVKTMQRNWIGRSEGAQLEFRTEAGHTFEVFTTRPDTVWGATFMVMAPEHPMVESLASAEQSEAVSAYVDRTRRLSEVERMTVDDDGGKTGVFTGSYAINPVNDEKIPIWIADYVLMGYGTEAIMAVPAHDQRDFDFARRFDLPIRVVIQPDGEPLDPDTMTEPYSGSGHMVNSAPFNGLAVPENVDQVIAWLDREGRGRAEVNYRLRDWLFARQRYWGTPIPIVYCDQCGIVPAPDEDLPIELPADAEFTPTGQSPLVTHQEFLHTTCPNCGGPARRETDTMDTFVDSSWYWFRYTANDFMDGPIDPERAKKWTPVDLYCGGIEHAILHLLYSRFITKVLNDMGLVDHREPFLRLRNQGMILAEEGTKMSKSRGTQVDPDRLVAEYGADALRLHLMYLGPWEQGGPWNSHGITGMERFIRRAYTLVAETASAESGTNTPELDRRIQTLTHKTIKRVTEDLVDFHFNTMVAALIECVNGLLEIRRDGATNSKAWREAIEVLVQLMAPSTPYIAEEMWELLGNSYSVHQRQWPEFDEALTRDQVIELVVQINGKVRDRLSLSAEISESEITNRVLASERVKEYLGNTEPLKVIYVPGKLINLVVRN